MLNMLAWLQTNTTLLQLISVNIPAFEVAIAAAVAAPYTDCQGFGVWSLLIISV